MGVGKPFDIGGDYGVEQPQVVHQPVIRAVGSSVGEGLRPTRAHHSPECGDDGMTFGTRQPADEACRRYDVSIQRQMPGEIVAEPYLAAGSVLLPEQRITPADALGPATVGDASAQPVDEPLGGGQSGAQFLRRKGRREEMGCARVEQGRNSRHIPAIDNNDERAAARVDCGDDRSDQTDVAVARAAHVDKGYLRIAVKEALRGVIGPAGRHGAPANLPHRIGEAVAVARGQNEETTLPIQCGFTAHA